MFYIRADGNNQIGMGHIARCVSIALAIREKGQKVIFLTADENPVELIKKNGFEVKVLSSNFQKMEEELPQLSMIFSHEIEENMQIIVDSYYVTVFYLETLRRYAKVILLDDNKKQIYPCDVLLNYNIHANELGYEFEYPKETKLLLGCNFVPLRPVFWEKENGWSKKTQIEEVLFTTGGGDQLHIALLFCHKILLGEMPRNIRYHIVCGPFCEDNEQLKKLAEKSTQIVIHEKVSDMATLMKSCDTVIASAGSTLYELCAMGIPTIGFYFVENQRQNMEAFARKTCMPSAGDFSINPQEVLGEIKSELEEYSNSYALREKVSLSMQRIIDGHGAQRIADNICSS